MKSLVCVLWKSLSRISLYLSHSYPSHPYSSCIFSLDPFQWPFFPIWTGKTATANKNNQVYCFCIIPGKQRAQTLVTDKIFFFEGSAMNFRQSGRQVGIWFQPSCPRQVMKNSERKIKAKWWLWFSSLAPEMSKRKTAANKIITVPTGFHTPETLSISVFKVYPDKISRWHTGGHSDR